MSAPTKYDDLTYRENNDPRLRNDWLRCLIGRVRMEKHIPKYPAEPVFYVLGFGRTMLEAEQMVERKLGRVVEMNGENGVTS